MKSIRSSDKIAMIILAAGESSRMGTNKQLLPWNNHNLINQVISVGIKASLKSIYVVLGARAHEVEESLIFENIKIIINHSWKEGMGASLASAIHYLFKNKVNYDAILIALVDQPLLEEEHYKQLIYNYINSNKNIIATRINKRGGVPAIINSKYFEELSELKGDHGAREIIASNSEDVLLLKPLGQIVDIDTLDTYNILYRKYGKRI